MKALIANYLDWVTQRRAWARFVYAARAIVASGSHATELHERNRRFYGDVAGWFARHRGADQLRPLPTELVLPLIVGFLSYAETAVFNPVTRTISGRPIGWNLSNYPGVADGRNDFKGYFKNRREALDTRS